MDCSEDLAQRGVVPLMPFRDVYHLCYDAVPILARRKEHTAIWEDILSSIAGITVRMEPKETGAVFLDITRLPGMFKSEEQIARTLAGMISEKFRLDVKVGIASSRFLAFKAASSSSGNVCIVTPGMERDFLSSVGIGRLPMPDDICERSRLPNLHSLGQTICRSDIPIRGNT